MLPPPLMKTAPAMLASRMLPWIVTPLVPPAGGDPPSRYTAHAAQPQSDAASFRKVPAGEPGMWFGAPTAGPAGLKPPRPCRQTWSPSRHSAPHTCAQDRASPEKSGPEIALNRRTLKRKPQKMLTCASPISTGQSHKVGASPILSPARTREMLL